MSVAYMGKVRMENEKKIITLHSSKRNQRK
nr:MAG TPA: hypothetical protein [Caudoviricetes sp.]